MNWLRKKILNWLHRDQVAEAGRSHSLGMDNPLMFNLGQASDRHYIAVPVENGFALITRSTEDYQSAMKTNSPRAVVTFCPTAEDLSNAIVSKMALHKLTAR